MFVARVFVNGRGRDAITQDMRRRIERGDISLEIEESIKVREPPVYFALVAFVTPLGDLG
jgi:hypothetical protein